MTTIKTSLRETARQRVIDNVSECAAYQHRHHYHKLHIHRNGDVEWTNHINTTDDFIDRDADHFAPIPSVATVGTGSYACNCEYCNMVYHERDEAFAKENDRPYDRTEKYETQEEAIADAVADSDLSDLEADMLAEFDRRISAGYFDDEEVE